MGFWKKFGKGLLKVGKIAAPIALAATGVGLPAAVALSAGLSAADKKASGGSWKDALISGGIGAGTGFIPGAGGVGGAVGNTVAKVGIKELAKGVAKGAATNFATGTGTALATGQGVKRSLQTGGQSALSGLGTTGGAGGFKQAATNVGKNVALNAGGAYASRGLQQAGVPGGIAAQGGNVFSQYLGNQFTKPNQLKAPSANGIVQQPGPQSGPQLQQPQQPQQPSGGQPQTRGLASYLPQGGVKDTLLRAGVGAITGAQQGGGVRGAVNGAVQGTVGGGTGPTNPNGPVGGGGQQGPPGADNTTQSPGWWEKYGPLIVQGGGVVTGALVGREAQKNAMERSPEELAALGGAQRTADQTGRLGGDLARQGQDYLQRPGQYFQTLLGGNRAAMSQAVAAPTAQITGNYRGAERALDHAGIRGAARDQAMGDLNRQRVSQIAGLTTGIQPYAAEQLAGMGQNAVQAGITGLSNAGNIYGNLLGEGYKNRVYAREQGADTAGAIGGLARDVGEVVFRPPQAPGVPAPSDQPKQPEQGGTPKAPPAQTPQTPQAPPSTLPTEPRTWTWQSPSTMPTAPAGTAGGYRPNVTFGTPPAKKPNPYNISFGGVPVPKNPNPYNTSYGDYRG